MIRIVYYSLTDDKTTEQNAVNGVPQEPHKKPAENYGVNEFHRELEVSIRGFAYYTVNLGWCEGERSYARSPSLSFLSLYL